MGSEKIKEVLKLSIYLFLLFSLAGFTLLAACAQHELQPRIHFDNDVFNAGNISFGERLTYTFHFSNQGNAPLIIGNVTDQALEGC
jgi:hypothetical protein